MTKLIAGGRQTDHGWLQGIALSQLYHTAYARWGGLVRVRRLRVRDERPLEFIVASRAVLEVKGMSGAMPLPRPYAELGSRWSTM